MNDGLMQERLDTKAAKLKRKSDKANEDKGRETQNTNSLELLPAGVSNSEGCESKDGKDAVHGDEK